MAKIKVRNNIDIERNPVERILMKITDFLKENRKVALYSLVGIFAGAVILIAASVLVEIRSTKQQVRYEEIMDNYYKNSSDKKVITKTIADLKDLANGAYFGFAAEMPYYVMGNLHFELKNYDKARSNLLEFADKSSSDVFCHLALVKAALASEESGKIDESLKLLLDLEKKYPEGMVTDQILYNIGRIYIRKGEAARGKTYFSKVMALYPQSAIARKAKQRLILAEKK